MDPITQAILLSITGNFATDAIKTAYKTLKNALTEKFGEDSDLVDAVNKLEKTPDRDDRKATVQTEIKITEANDDREIVRLAQNLLEKLKENTFGGKVSNDNVEQNIAGDNNKTIGKVGGDATIN